MKNDSLGDRIKNQYEGRTRFLLPRRTYTVLRIDGKAFHTYTKGLKRPFDEDLMADMVATTMYLCENIQGCKLGYTQSDEISLVLTDLDKIGTNAWFDGNVQKIVSIAASLVTAEFNKLRLRRFFEDSLVDYLCNQERVEDIDIFKMANFDARAFTIPDREEVLNYLVWRQQDASRNSIQMLARSLYSHKECQNKNGSQLQDMIHEKGQNWNDLPANKKRGSLVIKLVKDYDAHALRESWKEVECPIFTQKREFLKSVIPVPAYD